MQKLIVHLVVAAAIWVVSGYFAVPTVWRIGLLMAGAVSVHLVWERLFADPFLDFGARAIDRNDPLMIDARRRARETMTKLRELYPNHKSDTVVRFGLKVKSGKTEYVWGDLLELGESRAKVFLRTAPVEDADIPDRTFEIPFSDIDDWQIEFRDGTLRGGFTNRAVFHIYEREERHLPRQFLEQLQRFKDDDILAAERKT